MRFFPQFPNGLSKCLTLSYDDSTIHNLQLVEIFNKYNLKATFHINSALLGTPNNITAADVTEKLAAPGHEISCHTANHPFLDHIPPMEAMREVWDDRATLEKLTGLAGTSENKSFPVLFKNGFRHKRFLVEIIKMPVGNHFIKVLILILIIMI